MSTAAVVLVGGLGSRLRPLTFEKPKPLLPIGGRPALWHLLNSILPLQVERIFLACRYAIDQFRQFKQDLASDTGFNIEVIEEDSERGTGGALAALGLNFRLVWVFNGDTLMDLDTRAMLSLHNEKQWSATMAVVSVDDPGRYGSAIIEQERLQGFIEKGTVKTTPGWINAGAYLMEGTLLKGLPSRRPLSLEREVFPHWIDSGIDLGVYRHSGYFIDIGTPQTYLESQGIIMKHRSTIHPTASIHPHAHLEGALSIGPQCVIGAGVHLIGPTALGRQVFLGDGCWVENCVIWDKARVGAGSRLLRCILGSEVELTPNTVAREKAKVGLSPLEPHARNLEIQFGKLH